MNEISNKKSIGILTFLHTLNYGAIFQAYALEKVLQTAGFNAIQLDYRNPKVEAFEFKHATSMKGHIANLVRRPIVQKKEKLFDAIGLICKFKIRERENFDVQIVGTVGGSQKEIEEYIQ